MGYLRRACERATASSCRFARLLDELDATEKARRHTF